MFVMIPASHRLWRKFRFGAIVPSFIPNSCQTKVGAFFYRMKMDKTYSLRTMLINDKKSQASLASPLRSSNFTIAVEGNIGSGKTTLLNHFKNNSVIETITEPIEQWTNVRGHNALGLLYDDPQRWSFSFNMYAMLTRVNMHTQTHTKPIKMLERSLYSTKYCFIQNSYLTNDINGFENSVLDQWYNYLISDNKAPLDLIVYVRADPETCYERLKCRSRKEEAGVPKAFLESLHNLHDDWLIHEKYPLPAPVLVVDANYDMSTMKEKYNETQQEILCNYS